MKLNKLPTYQENWDGYRQHIPKNLEDVYRKVDELVDAVNEIIERITPDPTERIDY